jgi:hypothetical protein
MEKVRRSCIPLGWNQRQKDQQGKVDKVKVGNAHLSQSRCLLATRTPLPLF